MRENKDKIILDLCGGTGSWPKQDLSLNRRDIVRLIKFKIPNSMITHNVELSGAGDRYAHK